MASDIWLRTILIVRKETRCRHMGYSYRLTARVLLYAPSHRQDNTYHGLCYTSRGALAGTRTIMKDKVTYTPPSTAENLSQALKEVCVIELTQEYCESQVSSMPRRIQAVTDSKEGQTKYRQVVTLRILYVIKFQIVLNCGFGEINVNNLE